MDEKRDTPLSVTEVASLIETNGIAYLLITRGGKSEIKPVKPNGIITKDDRFIVYHDKSVSSELYNIFEHVSHAARDMAFRLRLKAEEIIPEAEMWKKKAKEWDDDDK